MSPSEKLIHQILQPLVEKYHPFAVYEGYTECSDFDGFLVAYRGTGDQKFMLVDSSLNIVDDQTMGTERTSTLVLGGLTLLGMFFGGNDSNQI